MVDKELLDILVCPDDKSAVRPADAQTLAAVNTRIRQGGAKNRGNQPVTAEISEGLVRADGKYLYIVDNDVPVMLIDEAIPL
jgi:uncharacterized protein